MADKIDTPAARAKLTSRRSPYWHKLQPGRFLGYRTMQAGSPGNWIAKLQIARGDAPQQPLGKLEDIHEKDRFVKALELAQKFFAMHEGSAEAIARGAVPAHKITLMQALEAYALEQSKKTKPGKPTYGEDLKHRIKARFELLVTPWPSAEDSWVYKPIVRITENDFKQWVQWVIELPVQQRGKVGEVRTLQAVNRDVTMLRAALNLMHRSHRSIPQLWKTPLGLIKRKGDDEDDVQKMGYLSPQVRGLIVLALGELEGHPPALVPMVRAMDLMPIRPGALSALTLKQYDKHDHKLHVFSDKAGQGRRIALPRTGPVAALVADLVKDKLPGAFLFIDSTGKPWNASSWGGAFKQAVTKLGPDVVPAEASIYWLRHACITDMVRRGYSSQAIAKMAGTSEMMIAKHYFKLTDEHMREMLGEAPVKRKATA